MGVGTTGRIGVVLVGIAASTAADGAAINFDDLGTSGSIGISRYAAQGVLMSLETAPGPFGDGTLVAVQPSPGLPAPAAGLGIKPYGSLAGELADFKFDFTTPIDAFSLYAFGDQAVRAEGYRGGVVVDQFSAPAQVGRVVVELTLGAAGGAARYDRVVVRVSHDVGGPHEGPNYFDELTFHPVPAPAAAALIAGGMIVLTRRRR